MSGVLGAQARLPVRVIAFRLSEASVNRARRRLREYARKKGKQPTQARRVDAVAGGDDECA
jgi:hypothetical protein